jgi:hypothetical protein
VTHVKQTLRSSRTAWLYGASGEFALFADLEAPSPQTGLDLHKSEFNAPAVHDL